MVFHDLSQSVLIIINYLLLGMLMVAVPIPIPVPIVSIPIPVSIVSIPIPVPILVRRRCPITHCFIWEHWRSSAR